MSLAAALVHDPELLILDEPTVGVDPLLRTNIWKHLVEITKHGKKTVIITTHYIDETRQAHLVSLKIPLKQISIEFVIQQYKFLSRESLIPNIST